MLAEELEERKRDRECAAEAHRAQRGAPSCMLMVCEIGTACKEFSERVS